MPTHILALMIAGGLLLAVGILWFLSVAFRYGLLWGFLCIILGPLGILVFLGTHWKDANKPFLMSLLGGLLFGASMIIAAYEESKPTAEQTAQLAASTSPTIGEIRPTPASVDAAPALTPESLLSPAPSPEGGMTTVGGRSPEALEQQPSTQPTVDPAAQLKDGPLAGIVRPPRPPTPPSHVSIKVENLAEHLGEVLRFRLKNGRSFEGRVREIADETLKVERNTNAGKMTFDIRLADVEEILKRL